MQNKIAAIGFLASIALAFVGGMFQANDSIYTVAGVGMSVFGIWSSVLLLRK